MTKYSIKPILKANRLPVQFSIIVPSTKLSKSVSDKTFNSRVKQEKEYLTRLFGGETAIRGTGSYVLKASGLSEKKIPEKVMLIEASTTPDRFQEKRKEISNHIRKQQKSWQQDTIFYKIEGESFIYPKKDYIDSDNSSKAIKIT